jgi:hypothetical protein
MMAARKTAPMTNLWLREPRKGWRNDGGPIPYRLRGRLKRDNPRSGTVIIDNPFQRVRVGHWIVLAGHDLFAFSPDQMKRLYSRMPLPITG